MADTRYMLHVMNDRFTLFDQNTGEAVFYLQPPNTLGPQLTLPTLDISGNFNVDGNALIGGHFEVEGVIQNNHPGAQINGLKMVLQGDGLQTTAVDLPYDNVYHKCYGVPDLYGAHATESHATGFSYHQYAHAQADARVLFHIPLPMGMQEGDTFTFIPFVTMKCGTSTAVDKVALRYDLIIQGDGDVPIDIIDAGTYGPSLRAIADPPGTVAGGVFVKNFPAVTKAVRPLTCPGAFHRMTIHGAVWRENVAGDTYASNIEIESYGIYVKMASLTPEVVS